MNRLTTVIGLAPSELDFSVLVTKLQQERTRVREALERFRQQPVKKAGAVGKTTRKKASSEEMNIKQMLKEGKITMPEILQIIQGAKKR